MPGEAGLLGSGIGKTKGLFKASTIPSAPHTIRTQILRALHAEGAKRRLGHEEIRAISRERFGVGSMGDLEVDQVRALYGQVVGWDSARSILEFGIGVGERRPARQAETTDKVEVPRSSTSSVPRMWNYCTSSPTGGSDGRKRH